MLAHATLPLEYVKIPYEKGTLIAHRGGALLALKSPGRD